MGSRRKAASSSSSGRDPAEKQGGTPSPPADPPRPASSPRRRPARKRSTAELAAATGYGPDAVRRFLARGWDGDPATLETWRAQNLGQPGRRPILPRADRPEGAGDQVGWGEKFRQVRTMREQVELRARMGQLVDRELVERMLLTRVAEVRAALLSVGRSMRLRLENQPGDVVERLLDQRMRGILEDFARPPELGVGGPSSPAKAPTGKRRRTRAGRS